MHKILISHTTHLEKLSIFKRGPALLVSSDLWLVAWMINCCWARVACNSSEASITITKFINARLVVRSPLLLIWILWSAFQPVRPKCSLIWLVFRSCLNNRFILSYINCLWNPFLVFEISGTGKVVDLWQFYFVINIESCGCLRQNLLFLNLNLSIARLGLGGNLAVWLVLNIGTFFFGTQTELFYSIYRRVFKRDYTWVLLPLSLSYVRLGLVGLLVTQLNTLSK